MIARALLVTLMLATLGALLYLRSTAQSDAGGNGAEPAASEPGYVALQAELIETGEDGRPLYRLRAARMEQPQPQGTIFLDAPQLDYEPAAGNRWSLTALHGQLPQDARTAELTGAVHAEGIPEGTDAPLHLATEDLRVDMATQMANAPGLVQADWAGNRLRGLGMQVDLKHYRLQLLQDVQGVLEH